jgi:YVTN family beta-propeller protein
VVALAAGPDVIEFQILGSLEVVEDDRPLALGSPKQRALLAVLVIHRGETASSERLIDELWGEHAPASAIKNVQGYVSSLRKVLGEEMLITRGHGYLLEAGPGGTDVDRFEWLVSEGRRAWQDGDAPSAAAQLREGLAVWRGPALSDFAYESFAQSEIARLEELRALALEDRIEAELALGEHARLVGELEGLVREHPLREGFIAQLMLALYRSGRQADALESYRRARARLVDELGLEPGRELQRLERAILAQDPALEPPSRGAVRARPVMALRWRRGALLIAAGGALLLAALIAVAVMLRSSGASTVRVAPNSLAAIDVRSGRVTATVAVGARPGAVTFGAGSLWVTNLDDQTISRVDPATLGTLRTIPVAGPPTGIAATADGVWVVESNNPNASSNRYLPRSSVTVVHVGAEFDKVDHSLRIGNVDPAGSGAVAAQGNSVWVAPSTGLLTRVNAVTGAVGPKVDPNASPAGIAVGEGAVWLSDSEANNVVRVDPTGLLTPIAVGDAPTAIAVGAGSVWVVESLADTLVRIDPGTRSVTATIPVGRSPAGVAFGGGSVWVANSGDGTVTRIDPHTGKAQARIAVGGSPQALTVADGRVWVAVDAQSIAPSHGGAGGTLRVVSSYDDGPVDPAVESSEQLSYATCAQLLNYPDRAGQAGSQLIPEVAQTLPTRSQDGRTYTFTIRHGFRFSPPSNQPVTAQTFKGSIERTLNPKMHSYWAYLLADVVGARAYMAGGASDIAGVAASGDRLTVRLLAPAPDFLARLAQPAFCAVPSNTPINYHGVPLVPAAGPYYVASYTPKQGVALARNPNYHGDRPRRFARIVLTVGMSAQRAVAEIQAGTADYTQPGSDSGSTTTLAARRSPRRPLRARQRSRRPRDAAVLR